MVSEVVRPGHRRLRIPGHHRNVQPNDGCENESQEQEQDQCDGTLLASIAGILIGVPGE